MFRLSYKEIKGRMMEWRNLKRLHANAKERIETLEQVVKTQAEQIKNQDKTISDQAKMIKTLKLQIEKLRVIIFGKKKKNKPEESYF